MPPSRPSPSSLLSAFASLRISTPSTITAPLLRRPTTLIPTTTQNAVRPFSVSAARLGNWLEPNLLRKNKMMKGRPRVPTGGSTKGTTVVWGDFGLRMCDHGRRISAKHFKMAEDTIKARLRGQKYRLYKRKCCNVGVFISGNEMRMGKGKGSFDHWAARVAANQVVFEIRGVLHEQVIRDAFRLAGNKLPGQYEIITRNDPPVVGITKLENGLTVEDLKRPRKKLPTVAETAPAPPAEASSSAAAPPS
ncbi:ribosomal protein L10e/L16 [Apiosordaria backusii]|uniref:Ribosomal protein L10e/L16 n=1 Tax=Apiosordaria backusii TaxID=314023 RepID=A0AA40EXS7_9PEZI|nr:ribosomal protein L10e/L16 [Apiosordaria backusii]